MNFFQVAKLVCQLLIEFGPGIFNLGKQIHDMVEEWSKNKQGHDATPTAEEKALKFNNIAVVELAVRNKALSPAKIDRLREGVWTLNNRRKVT